MIDEVERASDAALARVAAATTADEVRALEAELLGKKGPFADVQDRPRRACHRRREEGRRAGRQRGHRSRGGSASQRAAASWPRPSGSCSSAAERLDLTEVHRPARRRGHAHVVTQAWERLEDVFIGLGFQVAEGPEVETDWYNFEALNMPPDHPARSMHDTFFVEHGDARHRRCCAPTRRRCRSA